MSILQNQRKYHQTKFPRKLSRSEEEDWRKQTEVHGVEGLGAIKGDDGEAVGEDGALHEVVAGGHCWEVAKAAGRGGGGGGAEEGERRRRRRSEVGTTELNSHVFATEWKQTDR